MEELQIILSPRRDVLTLFLGMQASHAATFTEKLYRGSGQHAIPQQCKKLARGNGSTSQRLKEDEDLLLQGLGDELRFVTPLHFHFLSWRHAARASCSEQQLLNAEACI